MLNRLTANISNKPVRGGTIVALLIAGAFTVLLLLRSVLEYSQPGPPIRQEIIYSYIGYIAYAMGRLAFWVFVLSAAMAGIGVLVYGSIASLMQWRFRWYWAAISGVAGLGALTAYAFLYQLLYVPSSIAASFNYRISRLYPVWEQLSPERLTVLGWALAILIVAPGALCALRLALRGSLGRAGGVALTLAGASALVAFATEQSDATPRPGLGSNDPKRPNILMIGSDSLRADRLGVLGYWRNLTPNVDRLAREGTVFAQCYVPIARTGPSLASMLTGVWPHTHGFRDNFISDEAKVLHVATLPKALHEAGYITGAVGDWAASDLGKITFGFDRLDVPADQWNAKFLIKQGPKDMRLFLVLFTHNRFGKAVLPELYYLAGVPLTSEKGRDGRRLLERMAVSGKPFFLNIFLASTHGPFGSAWPYYHMFSNPDYRGDSLFSLTRSSSAEEVVAQQGKSERDFDVQQMIDLYDGATKSFDDEVGRFIEFLKASGLSRNTIVIVYSDHGFDLFEQKTWGQGNVLSDEAHRIPLVIYDPRTPGGGRVVTQVVRSVDLMPTVLDLLDRPIPATVEGESFARVIKDPKATIASRPAFAETGMWISPNVPGLPKDRIRYPSILEALEVPHAETGTLAIKPPIENEIIRAKSRMIRTDRWKLIYFPLKEGASYQLYDMENDPGMRTDVSAKHPAVTAELKQQLVAWLKKDPSRVWKNDHLVPNNASLAPAKP